MRITLPSRRAAGLLAVSTIGFSTAVLGVADVASAADPESYTVDGDSSDGEYQSSVAFDVQPGTCAIDWQVTGGAGSDGATSTLAGEVDVVTQVSAGQHFVLTAGASAAQNSDEAGEASVVERAASADGSMSTFLSAAAGPAAGDTREDNVTQEGIGDAYDDDAGDGALGFVNARLVDCPQEPWEPELTPGDGQATLEFGDDSDPDYDDYNAITGYQYKLDSGVWTAITAAPAGGVYSLDLPLVNGVAHSVSVRSVSAAGYSAAVDAGTVTPYHPVGAPSGVVITPGMGSMKVSWSAPTDTGTFGLGGYEVYLSDENPDPDAQSGGGAGCSTEALSCLIGVESGHSYRIVVVALDSEGYSGGDSGPLSSGTIPSATPPATVPAGSGPVGTGGSTTLTAGASVTLTGSGYLPGSTVELFVYSTPRSLGTVVATDGTFSWTGVLPADLVNGQHHIVSAGVDPNGNPLYLVTAVTVSGGTAASTSGSLAYTGFSALPYVGGGVLALAAGAGLIVASRRRAGA